MRLPIIFSSDIETQLSGNNLNLGEVYQYLLSGEWGKNPDPTPNYENPIEEERIGNSHLDGE